MISLCLILHAEGDRSICRGDRSIRLTRAEWGELLRLVDAARLQARGVELKVYRRGAAEKGEATEPQN